MRQSLENILCCIVEFASGFDFATDTWQLVPRGTEGVLPSTRFGFWEVFPTNVLSFFFVSILFVTIVHYIVFYLPRYVSAVGVDRCFIFGGYDGQKNHNSLYVFNVPSAEFFLSTL